MRLSFMRLIGLSCLVTLMIGISGCTPTSNGPATAPNTGNSSPNANSAAAPAARSGDEISLLEAAIKGDTASVKGLLDKGVNPNTKDDDGRTPLTEAASYGHTEIVKLLISKGGNLWAKKKDGQTPMSLAGSHAEVVQLIKHNMDLLDAARNGDNKAVQTLLDNGAYVNVRDAEGRTPLTEAAWENRVDTVKLLLDKGADPNVKKDDGTSPLSIAVGREHKEIEELLKKAGAK